jgi:uncharacterized protein with GYD domain
MPKYLFETRYTAEGAIGLAKEGGTGRRDAVKKHLDELGGKLESLYFGSATSIVLSSSTCPTM